MDFNEMSEVEKEEIKSYVFEQMKEFLNNGDKILDDLREQHLFTKRLNWTIHNLRVNYDLTVVDDVNPYLVFEGVTFDTPENEMINKYSWRTF